MTTKVTTENRDNILKEFYIAHIVAQFENDDEVYSVWDKDDEANERHYLVQKSVSSKNNGGWEPLFTFNDDEGKTITTPEDFQNIEELGLLATRSFLRPAPKTNGVSNTPPERKSFPTVSAFVAT